MSDFYKANLDVPGITGMPDLGPILAQMPTEQQHRFESAGEFIKRLAYRVQKWRATLAEDEQPVVLAMLPDGAAIQVLSLAEDGHSGVVVEGLLETQSCMFISHQASLQILCFTQKVVDKTLPRRRIGFHVGGESLEA